MKASILILFSFKKYFFKFLCVMSIKRIVITVFLFATINFVSANISDYSFTNTSGSFTPLSGATQIFQQNRDNDNSSVYNIGFSFLLNGVSYTQFSVNVNGIVKLGSSAISGTNNVNDLSSASQSPLLAAFWDDLLTSGGNNTKGKVSYKLTGTSGSYVLNIEFYRMKSYGGSNNAISFQIKLFEGSNKIEYIYNQESAAFYNPSASIGIAGLTSGDFIAVYNSTDTATANSINDPANISQKPSSGRIFRFEPPNMEYSSSTITQTLTTDVLKGSTNNQIIGIEIVANGSSNPIDATSFSFSTNGCTNPSGDIQNAKLWSTGTSSAFATTSQLGSTISSPNGSFTINGFTSTLSEGTNYFWLSYDLKSGATNANTIDAECSSIIVDGSSKTPAITAPAGNRKVEAVMQYSSSTVTQITEPVGVNTVENSVIRIEIIMDGSTSPLNATSFTCNTSGTNNPTTNIQNAELYATGTSSTFSNSNQFGSTVSAPNGSMSFSGTYTLSQGTNYFWLTYDVKSGATVGEFIDGVCSQVNIGGSNKTPTTTAPSGTREIVGVFWVGGSGNSDTRRKDWNKAGNWSNSSVPSSTTDVVIPSGCTYEPCIYDGNTVNCRKITINSGATLTVEPSSSGRFSIYGELINNGTIDQSGSLDIYLRGLGKTIGGSGDFSIVKSLVYAGASYTLSSSLTLNSFVIDGSSTFSLSSFDLTITNDFSLNTSGVLNANTGNLIITDVSPTFTGTFNSGTGITYFNGTNSQTIPTGITYNTLKIKVNSGSKNLGSSSLSCKNIELTNPSGGIGTGKLNGSLNIIGAISIGANCTFDLNSYDCNIDSNWINNGNITTGSGDITFDGNGNQSIGGSTNETFYNLIVDKNSGTLNLADDITITNTLTLTDGNISLGSYNLELDNSATISGGSSDSYIEADGTGVVRKNISAVMTSDYSFPVGDNNDYSPFTFKLNSATLSSAYVSLSVTDLHHPHMQDASYITRYWTLTPNGISGSIDYNISYVYTDNDVVGNEYDLLSSKYSGGTTTIGGSVDVNTNTLSRTSLSSFSDFGGVNDDEGIPLPIELIDFSSKCIDDNHIELIWSTISETNNSHFEIQQSLDVEYFITIDRVEGAGNSNKILSYNSIIEKDEDILNYYRLKQIDFDGKFEYSKVIAVDCSDNLLNSIEVYPNPFTNDISIDFNNILKSKVKIEVRNKLGILIKEEVIEANNSNKKIQLSRNLSAGIYFVVISDNNETIVRKLVKQ